MTMLAVFVGHGRALERRVRELPGEGDDPIGATLDTAWSLDHGTRCARCSSAGLEMRRRDH